MKRFFCILFFAALAFAPAVPSGGRLSWGESGCCGGLALRRGGCPPAFAVENFVCVTKKGKRYHRAGCRTLKEADVQKMTRTEAENKGLTPCKICKP